MNNGMSSLGNSAGFGSPSTNFQSIGGSGIQNAGMSNSLGNTGNSFGQSPTSSQPFGSTGSWQNRGNSPSTGVSFSTNNGSSPSPFGGGGGGSSNLYGGNKNAVTNSPGFGGGSSFMGQSNTNTGTSIISWPISSDNIDLFCIL